MATKIDFLLFTIVIILLACNPSGPENGTTTGADTITSTAPEPAATNLPDGSIGTAPATSPSSAAVADTSSINVKVFPNDAAMGGFGYGIYVNGIEKVHQPNIPAVQGNKGFSSEEKARKAGEYVAGKVKRNIMPPSVTEKELDSLGVLK